MISSLALDNARFLSPGEVLLFSGVNNADKIYNLRKLKRRQFDENMYVKNLEEHIIKKKSEKDEVIVKDKLQTPSRISVDQTTAHSSVAESTTDEESDAKYIVNNMKIRKNNFVFNVLIDDTKGVL